MPRLLPILLMGTAVGGTQVAISVSDGQPSNSSHPSGRSVRWYVNAARKVENEEFVVAHPTVVQGLIGTTGGANSSAQQTVSGMIHVDNQGKVVVPGAAPGKEADYLKGLVNKFVTVHRITYHAAVTVDLHAIVSDDDDDEAADDGGQTCGPAPLAVKKLFDITQAATLTGVLVDYEPTCLLTPNHQLCYQAFLTSLATEAAARRAKDPSSSGLDVAMAVGDSGIIHPSHTYATLGGGLDWYTSMSPTLSARSGTSVSGVQYVHGLSQTFANRTSVSIGAMAGAGDEGKCERDYEWSHNTLQAFLKTLNSDGVKSIDVVRCDLSYSSYGKIATFFLEALGAWVLP